MPLLGHVGTLLSCDTSLFLPWPEPEAPLPTRVGCLRSMIISDQEARQILQPSLAKRPTSKGNPQGKSRVSCCSRRDQALDGV